MNGFRMRSNAKERKNKMSRTQQIGQALRVAVSQSEDGSRRPVDSREPTREEKLRFLEVAKMICPGFKVSEVLKPVLNDLVRWCLGLAGPYDPDKGLWLWGSIGTGKSTMLSIVKEYCRIVRPPEVYRRSDCPSEMRMEPVSYGFRTTNASEVAGAFAQGGYPAIDEYITSIRQAFDEIGRECIPTGFYGNMENVFQYILQRRYDLRHGDFTHVTSNLAPAQIAEVYGDHIYDRCIEMFNFVQMSGASWR